MNKWLKISSIVAIILTVGAVSMFSFASAQEPTDPEGGFKGRGFGRGHGHGPVIEGLRETMQAALADALGVTVEDLDAAKAEHKPISTLAEEQGVDLADVQAAMETAMQEAVQQAVADGTITQAQADRMSERGFRGPGFGGRGAGRHGGFKGGFAGGEEARAEMKETLAGALGITVEALDQAKADGQTLAEIAAANGVDMADVQATLKEAAAARIAQAVADGTITQAQADRMLERLEQSDGFKGFGPGRGFRRGRDNGGPNNQGESLFQRFEAPQGSEA